MNRLLALILIVSLVIQVSGQMAINETGALPDSSAMLDIASDNKGFLPPRMNEAQLMNIHNPAWGLLVFCTDCGPDGQSALVIYENNSWRQFSASRVLPVIPEVIVSESPTCSHPLGTLAITYPTGTVYQYSIDSTWQSTPIFTALLPGTYFVKVRFVNDTTSVSAPREAGIAPPVEVPPSPTIIISTTPSCVDQHATVEITDPVGATLEYSLDDSLWQSSTLFSNLIPASYSIFVRSMEDITCISQPSVIQIDSANCVPPPPSPADHVATSAEIVWNWLPVNTATGYKWNTTNNMETALDLGNQLSYTETGLNPITMYVRYIWAYNNFGISEVTMITKTTTE